MDSLSSRRIRSTTQRVLSNSESTKSLIRSRTRFLQDVRILRTSVSKKTLPSTNLKSPIFSPLPADIYKTSRFTSRSLKPKSKTTSIPYNSNLTELKLPKLSPQDLKLSSTKPTDNPTIYSKRRNQIKHNHQLNHSKHNVTSLVTRYAHKSRVGLRYFRNKKHNQDTYVIHPSLKQVKGQYLFAVCDGHGTYGHEVSGYIKENIAKNIEDSLPDNPSCNTDSLIASLRTAILTTHQQIKDSSIDIKFSGSTLNALVIRNSLLLCANVGDSRSVLARKHDNSWQAISLSRDHKPDSPQEEARINKQNGRVEPYYDQNGLALGPARVWLSDQYTPGLAMSRSLGDSVASNVGVIGDPDIQAHELHKDDKFIIVASDGLWEFISNEEAVYMISRIWESGNVESCCDELVKEAVLRWQSEDDNIDDITVIVIFLNVP